MEDLEEIYRGAEAIIYRGSYAGIRAVYKHRPSKPYRPGELDRILRVERTVREARLMIRLRLRGLLVPAVLDVDPEASTIVMEHVEGEILRDVLERSPSPGLCEAAGEILGRIHREGIYHGDPTISNYILDRRGRLWIIDFGLSDYTEDLEDFAVDLHLLYRSIETLPLRMAEDLKLEAFRGYSRAFGEGSQKILERVRSVRLRGRYVLERRMRTEWAGPG